MFRVHQVTAGIKLLVLVQQLCVLLRFLRQQLCPRDQVMAVVLLGFASCRVSGRDSDVPGCRA